MLKITVRAAAIVPTRVKSHIDHACLKCCGACMLTSVVPLAPQWTVVPVVSRISFASLSEQLRGHTVFVDPDIPKHIL